MAEEREASGPGAGSREAFAADLKRRGRAARGLEHDLLTDVPLLYGSPDHGDPGIVLDRLHREDMLRRNGGGVFRGSGDRSEVSLPFERGVWGLALILFLWAVFGKGH